MAIAVDLGRKATKQTKKTTIKSYDITVSSDNVTYLKATKSCLKWSYDKKNLTLVVISLDFYETHQGL